MLITKLKNFIRDHRGVAAIETAIIFTFVFVPVVLSVAEFMNFRKSVQVVSDSAYFASLAVAGSASEMSDADIKEVYSAYVGQSATISLNDVCVTKNALAEGPKDSQIVTASSCGAEDAEDGEEVSDEELVIWKRITVSQAYQKLFELAPTSQSRITVTHHVRTQ